ncbi:MAG: hypothetical protein HYX75_20980 [Acidobacteria bacterium]|nr:hypothetical protein [Acidobacteriota bacterium]
MKPHIISAEALAPLVVKEDRQSSKSGTLTYIPGSTLLGAMAATYCRSFGGPADAKFRDLFIENPVCFPDLLPSQELGAETKPLPLSVVSCKREPGFRKEGRHGVRDTLALTAVARVTGKPANQSAWNCDHDGCKNEVKTFEGVWNGDCTDPHSAATSELYRRHTGIDRLTRTVAQGIFYTTQSVNNFVRKSDGQPVNQIFCGQTRLSPSQAAVLNEIFGRPVFVGAGRTRGFGEIRLSLKEVDEPAIDVNAWDRKFRDHALVDLPNGLYFSVTLRSHAILVDYFLRNVADIDLQIDGAEEVARVLKAVAIKGWNWAWGMAKPEELGVARGSVFLFRYRGGGQEELARRLARVSAEGIGLRRQEGFGSVSVCDPLHVCKEVL